MKSRNKGITLISLVITIVIMLILTGITINLLFGDNGLITKTKLAKKAFLGEDAKEVVEDRVNAYIAEKGPEGELDLYDFWYMYNGDSNLETYDEDFIIYLFEEDAAVNFTPSVQSAYTKGTRYISAVVIYKGYQMTVNNNFTVAKEVKAIVDLTSEEVSKLENESIYTLNPNGWTNEDVTVTFTEKEGSTVYHGTSQENMANTGSITCSTNTKYYYKNVKNVGGEVEESGEINVGNIDKEKPTISTNLTGEVSGVNNNDIDLSIGVTDTLSGYSKVEFYHRIYGGEYVGPTTVTGTAMNGEVAGATVATDVTSKLENLNDGFYQIYAKVYDVAGNYEETDPITIRIGEISGNQYVIVEIDDHIGGNSAVINEIEIYNSQNNRLSYNHEYMYDSAGTPYWYNKNSIWGKQYLNDGERGYGGDRSTLFFTGINRLGPYTSPNSGYYARVILKLDSEMLLDKVTIYTGGLDSRTPENLRVYIPKVPITNNEYESICTKQSEGLLQLIGEQSFSQIVATSTAYDFNF